MAAATGNLPVAFAALLAGGLLLEHGLSTAKGAFSGGGSQPSTPPSSASQHGQVSASMLSSIGTKHGWNPSELADWMKVIMAESNGTITDTNPGSGAYGIAQFINGPGEYSQYGGNATTVEGQLIAMANYIAKTYGTPAAAWAHEQQFHWY